MELEKIDKTNAIAPIQLPAIHTFLQPYLLVNALTIGPEKERKNYKFKK